MADKARHPLVQRLIDLQQAFGLSGSEMARRLDVNPSSWTRLCSGELQPSLRVVQAAAAAFPEVRSLCVETLMIRTVSDADRQVSGRAAS